MLRRQPRRLLPLARLNGDSWRGDTDRWEAPREKEEEEVATVKEALKKICWRPTAEGLRPLRKSSATSTCRRAFTHRGLCLWAVVAWWPAHGASEMRIISLRLTGGWRKSFIWIGFACGVELIEVTIRWRLREGDTDRLTRIQNHPPGTLESPSQPSLTSTLKMETFQGVILLSFRW